MREALFAGLRALGRAYLRRALRRGLDGVYVEGDDAARAALARGPVVFAANHVSWWDGMIVVALAERLGDDRRVVMDAERLATFPFFRAFGVVGVRRRQGIADRQALRALTAHLDGPGRSIWIFPQGEQRPAEARPLGVKPGALHLARRAGAAVIPVCLDYPWGERPVPAARVRFRPALPADADEEALERALIGGLVPVPVTGTPWIPAVAPRDPASRALAALYRTFAGGVA